MYKNPIFIINPISNNAFSYTERKELWSTCEIYVPSLIQGTLTDLQLGSKICFEEVINGKIISCIWLKNFVQLDYHGKPIFIVDNHNHALSFRYNHRHSKLSQPSEPFNLIHIDQHSDMKPNGNRFPIPNLPAGRQGSWFPIPEIEDFVNTKTNVGNFIPAAINSWIINEVIQIRTDTALHSILNFEFWILNFILDIDIDFREGKEISQEEIQTIRQLISHAEIVTIATSPYFIDQKQAIHIIKKILWQV